MASVDEIADEHINCNSLDPLHNPHVHQTLSHPDYSSRTDVPFNRTLEHGRAQKLVYRRRKGELKTVIHWGQRKLLLCEVEFLLKYGEDAKLVVYAGAAPGTHIQYLSELFPHLHFVCVDPAPFTVKETGKILCRQELFTDELAHEYKNERGSLFISDIRSADWQLMDEDENEKEVQDNMNSQKKWHEILDPIASLLKFRLPWTSGKTQYLDGEIYLPVWGPITTTESRLMVTRGAAMREYDNTTYEQEMFYFNTVQRVALYPHNTTGEGLDHCYDCMSEIHILEQCVKQVGFPEPNMDLAKFSSVISRKCSSNRRLCDPNPDPEDRKRRISQRQFIEGKPAYVHEKEKKRAREEHNEQKFDYSTKARAMLSKHGFQEGQGLGVRSQGRTEPVAVSTQVASRGLGFNVHDHRPWNKPADQDDRSSNSRRASAPQRRDHEDDSSRNNSHQSAHQHSESSREWGTDERSAKRRRTSAPQEQGDEDSASRATSPRETKDESKHPHIPAPTRSDLQKGPSPFDPPSDSARPSILDRLGRTSDSSTSRQT